MKKSTATLALTASMIATLCNHNAAIAPVNKSAFHTLIKSFPVVTHYDNNNDSDTSLYHPINTVSTYFHRQMDYNEYTNAFKPSLQKYFEGYDIRYNFCGTMTLLNALDIMSERQTSHISEITAAELANTYYVDNYGEIINTYKNGDPAVNPSGSMNDTAMYWLTDTIGQSTGLWSTKLLHGNNNSTWSDPVKKSELNQLISDAQVIFNQSGILIISAGINHNSHYAYDHFLIVLNIRMNADNSAEMLIVDSMGADKQGFYGWVNSDDYFISTNEGDQYTGIMNVYGLIPLQNDLEYFKNSNVAK